MRLRLDGQQAVILRQALGLRDGTRLELIGAPADGRRVIYRELVAPSSGPQLERGDHD